MNYYVEDHVNGTLRANGTGGPPRTDKQPLVVAAPAVSATLGSPRGHDEQASYVSVRDSRVVSPEDDRDERLQVGDLELAGLRERDVGVAASLDFAAVETHAVDEVGHASHHPKPAPGVKDDVAFVSENQRAEVLETPIARQLTGGGGKPGQGYPAVREGMGVRRLTPVECERLQGLPDGWTQLDDKTPDSRRYSALGDAVTATVGEWIGCRLLAAGDGQP